MWFSKAVSFGRLARVLPAHEGGAEHGEGGGENDGAGLKCANEESRVVLECLGGMVRGG